MHIWFLNKQMEGLGSLKQVVLGSIVVFACTEKHYYEGSPLRCLTVPGY